jgi:hypothetical protein
MTFNPLYNASMILMESTNEDKQIFGHEFENVQNILEDANSPITSKYKEKLYKAVLDKGHIDFGSIPASKGNIREYSGYHNMIETLDVITGLGTTEKSNVVKYANTVLEAIKNIESLSSIFEKGFASKCEYVMLEYNTYVYTCVEATTTLIYEFVEFVKRPDKTTYQLVLKDTKLRANLFYFEQLASFNTVNKNMHVNYRKMLESMINQGKNNFTGVELIGIATVSMVALAIIPITRELIYHFYNLRANLSNELELQANFLEMNKTCVESNSAFTEDKKKKILARQESLRKKLIKISDMLRVKEAKAGKESKRDIEKDNAKLTVNGLRDEISNSPLELI